MKNIIVIWIWRQWKEHISELIKLREENIINKIYVYDVDFKWIEKYSTWLKLLQLYSINNLWTYKIDFWIICTPNVFHKWIVEILCLNGINILKEKPFWINIEEWNFIKKLVIKE